MLNRRNRKDFGAVDIVGLCIMFMLFALYILKNYNII